ILDPGDPGHRDGASGHGSQSRARPGRDLPAGAEDGVRERAGGPGVEAVLQRNPGDPGIAEVLGNDEGSHRDPGDEVAFEPTMVIGADPSGDAHKPPYVPRRSRLRIRSEEHTS